MQNLNTNLMQPRKSKSDNKLIPKNFNVDNT